MYPLISLRPPRIALVFLLVAIVIDRLLPLRLHPPLPLAASLIALTGLALMLRAWWLFHRATTAVCPTDKATTLLTHDVYSLTRNPMYLGILLMFAALAMASGDAAFYTTAIVYAAIIDRVFVRFEERKSSQEFGDHYHAYTRRVRRWL